jgi:hypothetical protein
MPAPFKGDTQLLAHLTSPAMSDSVIQVYPGEFEEAKKLLAPLRETFVHKPPFVGGLLQLPPSHFYLLYKTPKDGHGTRFVCADSLTQLLPTFSS